ncbi:MAG: DUF2779 domain-containing protein, partial [Cyclobacteriaceae bacterium]
GFTPSLLSRLMFFPDPSPPTYSASWRMRLASLSPLHPDSYRERGEDRLTGGIILKQREYHTFQHNYNLYHRLEKHLLSKSTFMYGCQCPKRLFLHKHKPSLRNPADEKQQAILDAGTSVGELARKLFNYGIDVTPPDFYSYHLAVKKTQALIARGETILYEATFQYEGVLCALDILVQNGTQWYAFEVKSTTRVKPQHIQDAALQYYVLKNSGLPISEISIIYLYNNYVRQGALDIKQLFSTESVLEEVLEQQETIAQKVAELKAMLSSGTEPIIDIGPHCVAPYPCDFMNYCWAHVPTENSVFELARSAGWKLYAEGYHQLDQIPDDYELNTTASLQLAQHRSGAVHMDREALQQFLVTLTYPLYFLDFETMMPGIPEFDHSRPYQQIPFQFSLHVQHEPGGTLEHYEFLGDGLHDPRKEFTEALLLHLGNKGSIVCYNMSFEKSRLNELAELFPEQAPKLDNLSTRIVDLMIPFRKQWYYHPDFKGSYSIKAVLPVLVQELRYDELDIQEGSMASLVYSQLKHQDAVTATIQRQALREYCKLDTLAMVKIVEVLRDLTPSPLQRRGDELT